MIRTFVLALLLARSPLAILVAERTLEGSSLSLDRSFANLLLSSNVPLASQRLRHHVLGSDRVQRFSSHSMKRRGDSSVKGVVASQSPSFSKRSLVPCMAADAGDDAENQGRMELTQEWNSLQVDKAMQMGRADDIIKGVSSVWVLLSGSGNGVYLHNGFYVLVFEEQSDAERYAYLAGSEGEMTPVEWKVEQLFSFCHRKKYEVALAQKDQLVIPTHDQVWEHWNAQDERSRETGTDSSSRGPYGFHHSGAEQRHVSPRPNQQGTPSAWIVIFNPGQANEGIYTLQNAGMQSVLAFKHEEDARAFAGNLQVKSGGHLATPVQWGSTRLKSFCRNRGFEIRIMSEGMRVPDVNEFDVNGRSKPGGHVRVTQQLNLQNQRKHLETAFRRQTDSMNRGAYSSGRPHMDRRPGWSNRVRRWIIMINQGRLNEGVYTLGGSGRQMVLAFEDREDAELFSDKLQAQAGFHVATPVPWDLSQLSSFCRHGGFETHLVRHGVSIVVPEVNELDLQVDNQRALLEYLFKRSVEDDNAQP